jgi:ribonuclease T2
MRKFILWMVVIAAMVAAMPLTAAKKKKKKAAAPVFSYYLLSLSWAPDFCATAGNSGDPAECGTGKKIGFVVHGLWPQGDTGQGPENCKPSSTVPSSIVQQMLTYIPTASLIQHEWTTHGTCSGLNVTDYFAAVRTVRDSVKIPTGFQAPSATQTLSPKSIEAAFAKANPTFPATAFRTSCTSGELQEERICFAKDFSPRACTSSAGECTAATTKVLPVH